MAHSVGIIGMGWVGSSIAISLLHNGISKHLYLNDVRADIADGEAMDLRHGSSFFPAARIRSASVAEMLQCDVIVVTAGRGGKAGESRLELLQDNISIAKNISKELRGYQGILVIVSNPVDVLTYYYRAFTGLPANRVIGTGTFLDTARLRESVGEDLGLEAKSIQADVIGEHGDSAVVLWSGARIGGVPLRNWKQWSAEKESEIENKVVGAAQQIIRRKGATNHAIGLVTAYLVKYLLRDDRRVICVSSVMEGPYGLSDVALSLPSIISSEGLVQVLEPELDDSEKQGLLASAKVLSRAITEARLSS